MQSVHCDPHQARGIPGNWSLAGVSCEWGKYPVYRGHTRERIHGFQKFDFWFCFKCQPDQFLKLYRDDIISSSSHDIHIQIHNKGIRNKFQNQISTRFKEAIYAQNWHPQEILTISDWATSRGITSTGNLLQCAYFASCTLLGYLATVKGFMGIKLLSFYLLLNKLSVAPPHF